MGLIGTLQGSQGPAGPTGATGSAGTPGSQWFIEAGPPNDAQGIDNDNWLDTTNGNVYKKVSGTWF